MPAVQKTNKEIQDPFGASSISIPGLDGENTGGKVVPEAEEEIAPEVEMKQKSGAANAFGWEDKGYPSIP